MNSFSKLYTRIYPCSYKRYLLPIQRVIYMPNVIYNNTDTLKRVIYKQNKIHIKIYPLKHMIYMQNEINDNTSTKAFDLPAE